MNEKARRLVAVAKELSRGSVMVEIGSLREGSKEVPSDGWSTFYLAGVALVNDLQFHTVDSSADAIAAVHQALGQAADNIGVHCEDGEQFLRDFDQSIDLLYLDGAMDPAQALAQFEAAELSATAIVIIDDVQGYSDYEYGKGDILLEHLGDLGYEISIYPTEPSYLMAVCR